jgi:hypothetical protein
MEANSSTAIEQEAVMDVLDKDKALANPSSVFDRPSEVVANTQLSHDEKTRVLQEWELEARLLEVATEEGMNNRKSAPSVLPEVKAAQRKIGAEPTESDGSPTKT